MSASSSTISGPLPEHSMIGRLRPALAWIFAPVAEEPMKPGQPGRDERGEHQQRVFQGVMIAQVPTGR